MTDPFVPRSPRPPIRWGRVFAWGIVVTLIFGGLLLAAEVLR